MSPREAQPISLIFGALTIGAVCGNLLQSCGSKETHAQEKCLKDVRGVTLKAVLWDLLGDPPGENKGIRGAKIGIANKRKSVPTLGRDCTKPIG